MVLQQEYNGITTGIQWEYNVTTHAETRPIGANSDFDGKDRRCRGYRALAISNPIKNTSITEQYPYYLYHQKHQQMCTNNCTTIYAKTRACIHVTNHHQHQHRLKYKQPRQKYTNNYISSVLYYQSHRQPRINNCTSIYTKISTCIHVANHQQHHITIIISNQIKKSIAAYHPYYIISHTNNHISTFAPLFERTYIFTSPTTNNITMLIRSYTKIISINIYHPHHISSYINNRISTTPPLFTSTSTSKSPITNNITICIVNYIKNAPTTACHPYHITS